MSEICDALAALGMRGSVAVNAGISEVYVWGGESGGVVQAGANPARVDCICKMIAITGWKKAVRFG